MGLPGEKPIGPLNYVVKVLHHNADPMGERIEERRTQSVMEALNFIEEFVSIDLHFWDLVVCGFSTDSEKGITVMFMITDENGIEQIAANPFITARFFTSVLRGVK